MRRQDPKPDGYRYAEPTLQILNIHDLRVLRGKIPVAGGENVRLRPLERSGEIGDEIVGVFDADRVADEIVFDPDH